MNIRSRLVLASAGLALSGTLAAVPAADAFAGEPSAPTASAAQSCWSGGTHTTGGAKMQYNECRRTYNGRTQTSITIRVEDTKTDGMCGWARGEIGNTQSSAYTRVTARSCTTGGWSAWTRSGWWNGTQGYEYVYLGH
jgi:hypothetical protein